MKQSHFEMVHQDLLKRDFNLGRERKDQYAADLNNFISKGGDREYYFVDRMLFAAMVEARSCERFKLLSEQMSDPELREFYRGLMVSEAEHYTTFSGFAKKYNSVIDVEQRWKEFLEFEATLMIKYGKEETIHG